MREQPQLWIRINTPIYGSRWFQVHTPRNHKHTQLTPSATWDLCRHQSSQRNRETRYYPFQAHHPYLCLTLNPKTITELPLPTKNPTPKSQPPSENLQPTPSNKIRKKSVPPRGTAASLWHHHCQRHCHTRIANLSTPWPWHEVWRCTRDPFHSTHKYQSVTLFTSLRVVTNETHDHSSNEPSKSLKIARVLVQLLVFVV